MKSLDLILCLIFVKALWFIELKIIWICDQPIVLVSNWMNVIISPPACSLFCIHTADQQNSIAESASSEAAAAPQTPSVNSCSNNAATANLSYLMSSSPDNSGLTTRLLNLLKQVNRLKIIFQRLFNWTYLCITWSVYIKTLYIFSHSITSLTFISALHASHPLFSTSSHRTLLFLTGLLCFLSLPFGSNGQHWQTGSNPVVCNTGVALHKSSLPHAMTQPRSLFNTHAWIYTYSYRKKKVNSLRGSWSILFFPVLNP